MKRSCDSRFDLLWIYTVAEFEKWQKKLNIKAEAEAFPPHH